ncbi:hypothetical protein ZIOFF_064913 [Zingiber officinale]|uniref:SBP-type domain-containing protein n=1 Tax=Zingiber officinale TaxID=94328 RepID=A0A8J5EWL1_ZINOF|nr:hypothetical protein ZIOFF_064913 [Zingiber officinale]
MMNRSTSSSGEASTFVPSSMSFAGVGGSSSSSSQQTPKQQHFWEWETSSCSHITAAAASNNNRSSFFPSAAAAAAVPFQHFDHYFPAPPLLPINPYFASPAPLAADYPISLIKSELDVELGGGAIGLNLGHRTYFSSSNSSDQGFVVDRLFAGSSSSSSIRALQFQYPMFSGGQPPARCQAEGCKADLFRAKHYHRRHKVCEFHSKATLALVAGLQQRFCQQCSRFHVLAEFDEAKRSCRKRLADHNRRRRKLPLTAAATTTAVDVDSSIKPKPPQNSTGCNSKSIRHQSYSYCLPFN